MADRLAIGAGVAGLLLLVWGAVWLATSTNQVDQQGEGGAPKADMTFQQLEDRLNAGGLRVSRVASRRVKNAMWFGGGLRDVHPEIVAAWEQVGELYRVGYVLVTRCSNAKQAKEMADQIADVQQRPVFAWGPFVFAGKQEVLDTVKAVLDK